MRGNDEGSGMNGVAWGLAFAGALVFSDPSPYLAFHPFPDGRVSAPGGNCAWEPAWTATSA